VTDSPSREDQKYEPYGVVATSGNIKGALLTEEEAVRRGVTYERLYRRVP
jgi:hypothetical protein